MTSPFKMFQVNAHKEFVNQKEKIDGVVGLIMQVLEQEKVSISDMTEIMVELQFKLAYKLKKWMINPTPPDEPTA